MQSVALLVIAKEPLPGRAKTRLSPPCSPAQAAQLAQAALLDTLDAVERTPADRKVLIFEGDAARWRRDGFEVIGQRTYRVGSDPWVANLFKITGNFMIAAAIETMAEAFALVRKAGVDAQLFRELFTTSLFNAPIYLNYSDLVAREGDETVGFAAPLMLKDVRLALAASDTLRAPMPFASAVRDAYVSALARGYENRDSSVLGRVAAENAGINHRG